MKYVSIAYKFSEKPTAHKIEQVLKNTKIIQKINSLKQTTQWSECQ